MTYHYHVPTIDLDEAHAIYGRRYCVACVATWILLPLTFWAGVFLVLS